ncbi:hypothetical protein [Mongoliitalea lutea]|uniref:Uncharacterized protein n=1 Tax=Mongoliitalea lutea TaxID=849756 RepID=A0A8J3CYA6_9BACT|nr:hypothetical protein [Mongoliitalea lutea]GHB43916.1 hypothetical protein GCM10008106_26160 [Mongoliitalea lutea]
MMKYAILFLFLINSCSEKTISNEEILARYNTVEAKAFINPFSFEADPMERLLLVNFEKDPDEHYVGLEPQFFNDSINGVGLLVIAWRKDMHIDVYHAKSLNPNLAKFNIAGKGLGDMVAVDFQEDLFEITDHGVQVAINFMDKWGRAIAIHLRESNSKSRKPFGLLAPMGDAAINPSSMPLVWLEDFYFIRRKATEQQVSIDGEERKLDKLPIPMDGTWMYFARYSENPWILMLNPDQHGNELKPQEHHALELILRNGQEELKSLVFYNGEKQVRLAFEPSFPNILAMELGSTAKGTFSLEPHHKGLGMIAGNYEVNKSSTDAMIKLNPSKGWIPNPDRWELKFLYKVGNVFKDWPINYEWDARIDFSMDTPIIYSTWQKR